MPIRSPSPGARGVPRRTILIAIASSAEMKLPKRLCLFYECQHNIGQLPRCQGNFLRKITEKSCFFRYDHPKIGDMPNIDISGICKLNCRITEVLLPLHKKGKAGSTYLPLDRRLLLRLSLRAKSSLRSSLWAEPLSFFRQASVMVWTLLLFRCLLMAVSPDSVARPIFEVAPPGPSLRSLCSQVVILWKPQPLCQRTCSPSAFPGCSSQPVLSPWDCPCPFPEVSSPWTSASPFPEVSSP